MFPPLWQVATAKCIDCGTEQPFVLFSYDEQMQILGRGITTGDEGADLYLADLGQEFSRKTIYEDQRFTPLVRRGPSGGIFNPQKYYVGNDFYLAVTTGVGFNFPQDRDVYGWVHLKLADGQLIMLENAMAYDSNGIFIGTTKVVPEPAAWPLVMCSLPALLRWRS